MLPAQELLTVPAESKAQPISSSISVAVASIYDFGWS